MTHPSMTRRPALRAGDWVQVRSREEILSTLDSKGRLQELPFMPEMFRFCGQRFRVSKRAHKTCDPVNGLEARRMVDAVHLADLRCGGEAHDGCQAGCLFFWKESWLSRVDGPSGPAGSEAPVPSPSAMASRPAGGCSEEAVMAATTGARDPAKPDEVIYSCQATQVAAATTPWRWWDLRQYIEDFTSGNARLSEMLGTLCFFVFHTLAGAGLGLGAGIRWLYDRFQRLRGGAPYPWRMGKIRKGERTPTAKLDLQPGEIVHVKKYSEILETVDEDWKNRGLYFDGEMVPFCDKEFRVLRRVQRIIDEKTGRMLRFKNEALILDGVSCQARYAKCRKFCPRGYYLYWREIWVNRAGEAHPERRQEGFKA